MVPTLSLAGLLAQVFGTDVTEYRFDTAPNRSDVNSVGSPFYATDHMGREYFMPVKLGGILLPAPLIMVEPAPNNFAIRNMVHRDGTAKGLINRGDFRISVRGVCYDVNDRYPEEQVEALLKLFARQEALDIDNAITSLCLPAPQQVIIYGSPRIIPRPGFPGQVIYEMELLSDTPFTLTVTPK